MSCCTDAAVLAELAKFFPECRDIEHATLESLHVDSFALIEIVLGLESTFGFEFEDEKLEPEAFRTVGQLAQYVEERVSSNGPGQKAIT